MPSFLVSDLSKLLTSLILVIDSQTWLRGNERIALQKCTKKYDFSQKISFLFANDRFAKKEWFAHLLFYHEWPEQIAHNRSFVMSDLSDLINVAHLSWAVWENHSQSLICPERFEQIWANERIPNPNDQKSSRASEKGGKPKNTYSRDGFFSGIHVEPAATGTCRTRISVGSVIVKW